MNCLMCLKPLESKNSKYHEKCFKEMFDSLKVEDTLDFDRTEFVTTKARQHSSKMSISGVQPKLSLKIEGSTLVTTNTEGTYILKPTPEEFPQSAENEHLSLQIAKLLGLEVPPNCLIEFSDGEKAFLIKRYDRLKNTKLHQEDLAQAMAVNTDGKGNYKYESKTYEDIGLFLTKNISQLESFTFLKIVIVHFILGNGDGHLKNFSILQTQNTPHKYKLAPAYDILNTDIYDDTNELALDVFADRELSEFYESKGHHSQADFNILCEKFGIAQKALNTFYKSIEKSKQAILNLIEQSYLTPEYREKYTHTFEEQFKKLFS